MSERCNYCGDDADVCAGIGCHCRDCNAAFGDEGEGTGGRCSKCAARNRCGSPGCEAEACDRGEAGFCHSCGEVAP